MKRFLIFGLLGPLILGWAFAMLILPVEIDGYLINAPKALFLTIAFLPLTYLFGLVPGLAMAGVDAWLANYSWRLPAVCVIAYVVSGAILDWQDSGFTGHFLRLGLVGLIPTAICSWLSGPARETAPTP
jgi:hypothetical protein